MRHYQEDIWHQSMIKKVKDAAWRHVVLPIAALATFSIASLLHHQETLPLPVDVSTIQQETASDVRTILQNNDDGEEIVSLAGK